MLDKSQEKFGNRKGIGGLERKNIYLLLAYENPNTVAQENLEAQKQLDKIWKWHNSFMGHQVISYPNTVAENAVVI